MMFVVDNALVGVGAGVGSLVLGGPNPVLAGVGTFLVLCAIDLIWEAT